MSRFASAIRLRQRELDRVAHAVASEEARLLAATDAARDLAARRTAERSAAYPAGNAADAWFADTARRLSDFEADAAASNSRLVPLRQAVGDARARLSLLEEAAAAAEAARRRKREAALQASLDDRFATRTRR